MNISRVRRFASLCLIVLVTLLGCRGKQKDSAPANPNQIQVVATVGMVADVVRNVGGDHVDVNQICGSGVDPHLYSPNRDATAAMMSADLVFYCGLMLEGKMADALIKVARNKPVIAVTEEIDSALLLEPEEFAGHYDPHVWMDVSAWAKTIPIVQHALSQHAPEHAGDFANNAAAYQARLDRLHQYALDALGTIPESSRVLVTSHDAFNYFGRAYGLNVVGVQGLSTESEAGVQRINELVDLLVEKKIQAIFVESSVSPDNIIALQEGAASRGHQVTLDEDRPLFSDAMGPAGTYTGTYEGMLDHNITVVTRALGGTADSGGLNGNLPIVSE